MIKEMHRHLNRTPSLPLRLAAVMLAVLGLLAMHSLLAIAPASGAAAETHATGHQHSHSSESAHEPHAGQELLSSALPVGESEPCNTCCTHESETACPLTPAKVGNADALAQPADVYSSYGPAPADLTRTTGAQAPRTPPCLIALSISRT